MSTTEQAGPVTTDDQTFTEADLRAAVRRSGETESYVQALLADMRGHREPGYEPGGVYQDPEGGKWHFERALDDGSVYWLRPGVERLFSADVPRRPLRRLVPEGSQMAAADLAGEWRGLGERGGEVTPFRDGYRAALRKCADELECALKQGVRDEH